MRRNIIGFLVIAVLTVVLTQIVFAVEKLPSVDIEPNQIISSPLIITGNSNGVWIANEANLGTVTVLDADGNILGVAGLPVKGEWMTAEPVEFGAVVEFDKSKTPTGRLIFKNDNPSDMIELDKSFEIPVRFDVDLTNETSKVQITPPKGCIKWFDGCNTCVSSNGNVEKMTCTQMACVSPSKAYCVEYYQEPVKNNVIINILDKILGFLKNLTV